MSDDYRSSTPQVNLGGVPQDKDYVEDMVRNGQAKRVGPGEYDLTEKGVTTTRGSRWGW